VRDLTLAEIGTIDIGSKRGRNTQVSACRRWPK